MSNANLVPLGERRRRGFDDQPPPQQQQQQPLQLTHYDASTPSSTATAKRQAEEVNNSNASEGKNTILSLSNS